MTRDKIIHKLTMHGPLTVYAMEMGNEWRQGLERNIPEHMHDCVVRWVLLGHVDDDFLSAVIDGDLFEALAHADDTNRHALFRYGVFFHNHAPSGCFRRGALERWKGVYPDA